LKYEFVLVVRELDIFELQAFVTLGIVMGAFLGKII